MIPRVHTCVSASVLVCACGASQLCLRLQRGERVDGLKAAGWKRWGTQGHCEKSISSEYLIKFKPSDLSLLPGFKAGTDAGEGRGRAAGRREKRG